MNRQTVSIHTPEEVAMSRQAGHLEADVLRMITEHIRPGITTDDLDQLCHAYIVEVLQAIPANVGYNGFQDRMHVRQPRGLPRPTFS
jgi:methionyl aminopeptidase